jgi:alpha,alpha-trehalose phosphorylase
LKKYIEEGFDLERLPLLESLMSLGNGYIGARGYLEEFDYPGSVRGNYMNGIYERIPLNYAEWASGFPMIADRMPNLIDLFDITIFLDEEEVEPDGPIEDFVRELDFEKGLSRRSYTYETDSGKIAKLSFEQLFSFPYKELRSWSLLIEYDGEIEVKNHFDFEIRNMTSEGDPRIASSSIVLIETKDVSYEASEGAIRLKTINSDIEVKIDFVDDGSFDSAAVLTEDELNISYTQEGKLELTRLVKYWDSIRDNECDFIEKEELYKEQKAFLKDFDNKAAIEFLDNPQLDATMQFTEFHLLQATTQDIHGNISAKGLSGEGYEGHYFWDTEMFLFPVWLFWDKKRAKNLLLYRFNILPQARERARELGHRKGACFPWRTISGIESSSYFPAGTAQYHVSFDIAYTFIQYWLATKDLDYLAKYAMELVIETARTALEIGSFQNDGFHIHGVTGPDEYTAMVSDNYYTNKMAQYNLQWAVKMWHILEAERPSEWLRLNEHLQIREDEIEAMGRAAQEMVYIYDEEKGILGQDSTFLSKAQWPKESEARPLLLHYHPLTIYRYQILKQADTALALFLVPDVDEEVMKRTFYYYEAINTHDSSLSPSVTVLVACRLKDDVLAYKHFMDSVNLDLKDLNRNTADGLHMANIGGSILSVLAGFGGLSLDEEGLHIDPYVHERLGRIKIRFTWRSSVLEVLISEDMTDIKKISGSPAEVIVNGERRLLGQKAALFDLDGVLTGTSDNHYEAWKRMSTDLGLILPEKFRDSLRGISRMESLDRILAYFGLDYSDDEKQELADRKNNYYQESISHFTPDKLYPGARELLEEIKEKGFLLGLVSASQNAAQLVENMEIEDLFDVIIDPTEVERGKPFPDTFLKASEVLGLPAEDCLGIEDARAGIRSIKTAGMTAVGIGDEDLDEADAVFATIADASSYIINWLEA